MTGRLLDGENGHIGLVGITDLPFTGFVDAVRKANQQTLKSIDEQARAAAKVAPDPAPKPVPAADSDDEEQASEQ